MHRRWQSGDRVELTLDMPVRLMTAHALVEECQGQVAVQRGPLVYCLESIDLPKETTVSQVAVPADTAWTARRDADRLGNVVRLEGDLIVEEILAKQNPIDLYRPYVPPLRRTVEAELIPYFAWGNRGDSEMTVWLPVHD